MKYLILLLTLASCKIDTGGKDSDELGEPMPLEGTFTQSLECYEASEDGVLEIKVKYTHTSNDFSSTLYEDLECEAYENGVQVGYDKATVGFCTFNLAGDSFSIEFNDMVGQITDHTSSLSWKLSCSEPYAQ